MVFFFICDKKKLWQHANFLYLSNIFQEHILPLLSCPVSPSWQFFISCPVLALLSWLSSLAVHSWRPFPRCHVLTVCLGCSFLSVLSWMSFSDYLVLVKLFLLRLTFPGCPVLTVLSPSFPFCLFLVGLSWLSFLGCPALAVLSWLSRFLPIKVIQHLNFVAENAIFWARTAAKDNHLGLNKFFRLQLFGEC